MLSNSIYEWFLDKVGIHLVLDEGVPLTETIKRNPHFCKDGRFIKAWYAKPMRKFLSVRMTEIVLKPK